MATRKIENKAFKKFHKELKERGGYVDSWEKTSMGDLRVVYREQGMYPYKALSKVFEREGI